MDDPGTVIGAVALVLLPLAISILIIRKIIARDKAKKASIRQAQIDVLREVMTSAERGHTGAQEQIVEIVDARMFLDGPELEQFRKAQREAQISIALREIDQLLAHPDADKLYVVDQILAIIKAQGIDIESEVRARMQGDFPVVYQAAYDQQVDWLERRAEAGDDKAVAELRDLLITQKARRRYEGINVAPLPVEWDAWVLRSIAEPKPSDFGDSDYPNTSSLDEMSGIALDAITNGHAALAERVLINVAHWRKYGYGEHANRFGRSWELALGIVVRTGRPVTLTANEVLA
jgi:hypothetical protein